MSPESGIYIILNEGNLIGRRIDEDKSHNPKEIIKHDAETPVEYGKWDVEKVESDYILTTRGAYTSDIEGKVYAILKDEPPAERWTLKPVPQHGRNRYIITSASKESGWIAVGVDQQVLCRALMVGHSDPPYYPPNEVFEIVPIERD